MGFLIPNVKPEPNLLARLGRLLHWIGLGWAALLLLASPFVASVFSPVPAGSVAHGALREV